MESNNLPSQDSANDIINGVPGSLQRVVFHTLSRAAIIYVGIQVARLIKIDPPKNPALTAIAGSVAIEFFVLMYLSQRKKKEKENGEQQWSI